MSKLTKLINKVTVKVPLKKQYSIPRIYCGGGDIKDWNTLSNYEKSLRLKKDWYISWSFRNPVTGKMEQQDRIKQGNSYKTMRQRYKVLEHYRKELERMLKEGYNPYQVIEQKESVSVRSAFDKALELKKNVISDKYLYDISKTCDRFILFLEGNNYLTENINSITKQIVNEFLNHLLVNISAKTRNDFKMHLNGIFSELQNQDIIKDNFISTIPNVKREKKRSRTYSDDQVKAIENYLKKQDPQLLLFINFVSYVFLRPIEIVRLRVCDIDLKSRLIEDKTKTSQLKTKIIPDIIFESISRYLKGDHKPDMYLFTPDGIGYWNRKEDGRRAYFTKKYNTVKTYLEITSEYNIYSFRHTYITRLYQYLRKEMTKTQAIDYLSLCTGHTGNAIKNYIHVLDAELPKDYSKGLKL